MDEDDLMNVMEVSKQIEVSNVDDNLTVESDGIEQQIDLNKDIIKQQNKVELARDEIDDVPEVADADVVMEDVTRKITCDSALESFESHEIQTEGCETVIIRDKKPNDNIGLNAKKGKEQEKKTGTVAETARDYKVNDSLFLLSKDEGRMGTYVEKLKILLDEVKVDMPNPPSRNTGDVIGGIFSISKPNQVDVKNPTKAVNKGEHLKKGERLKSEREKALKVRAKPMKVCGYCKEKTTEHTKTTCPKNPKARKKKKATPVIDVY
ncbi:hypothetical protein Tco_0090808 [Tanacetum coccineum]